MPKSLDPAWQYAIRIPGYPSGTKCSFCHKEMKGGGISRFKQHIAGGNPNVVICTQQGAEIRQLFRNMVDDGLDRRTKKKGREEEYRETMCRNDHVSDDSDESDDALQYAIRESREENEERFQRAQSCRGGASSSRPASKSKGLGKFFSRKSTQEFIDVDAHRRPSSLQRTLSQTTSKGKDKTKEFRRVVAKWLHWGGISANSAANNPFWNPMFDAACRAGYGVKPPTPYSLLNPLLAELKLEIDLYITKLKEKWSDYGCTVMCDGWTGPTKKCLMNFLVYCDGQSIFVRTVNLSGEYKNYKSIMRHMRSVIDDVGKENVVQLVTDNGPNFKKAGERLSEKDGYHFLWSGCAAHCVDLILKEVSRVPEVSKYLKDGQIVTRYFYNHSQSLTLMREACGGDLVRVGLTRFATHFLAMQSLLQKKNELRGLMTSEEWTDLKQTRPVKERREMREVENILLDNSFWGAMKGLVRCLEPVVQLLRLVDGDKKPTMGMLHRWIEIALDKIKRLAGDHTWLLNIFYHRWHNQLGHKLHQAAYYLNPAIQYGPETQRVSSNLELRSSLKKVIGVLVPDLIEQAQCLEEVKIFREARGDFSNQLTVASREKMMPADWWFNFGGDAPHLCRVAIRILSQTVSSSGCERNWSTFGMIHSPKRCRLRDDVLHNLVYVHYNLRLKSKHIRIEESAQVNLADLYPPASDNESDDAFEWIQLPPQDPAMDDGDGYPDADLAQQMGEDVTEYPPVGARSLEDDFTAIETEDDTVRDLPESHRGRPIFQDDDSEDNTDEETQAPSDAHDDEASEPENDISDEAPLNHYRKKYTGPTEQQPFFLFTEDNQVNDGSQNRGIASQARRAATSQSHGSSSSHSRGNTTTQTRGNTTSQSRGDTTTQSRRGNTSQSRGGGTQGNNTRSINQSDDLGNRSSRQDYDAGRSQGNRTRSINQISHGGIERSASQKGSRRENQQRGKARERRPHYGASTEESTYGIPERHSSVDPGMSSSWDSHPRDYSFGGSQAYYPHLLCSGTQMSYSGGDDNSSYESSVFSNLPQPFQEVPEIRTYEGYPLNGRLLYMPLTQQWYDYYINDYLKSFSKDMGWYDYCNDVITQSEGDSGEYVQPHRYSSYL